MNNMHSNRQVKKYLDVLDERLLRLTSDSRYAHRASGLRGSIINAVSESEREEVNTEHLHHLINCALQILSAAAQEIPEPVPEVSSSQPVKD